ncbi:hypothetical protein I3843_05G231500 [Carya illinoinensis]|uniref:Uncharacterized protein n=1 Tax=Carya illinoinensis TaxID=32201 RepID=A0A8T1QN67_CARIL|nr:uncharacterized protein LOC122310844 isoform X2 [Carya illinoinensis]KAG6656026.1 hypothetical protein CIPAW_05G257900 [Carya illinoinensis]KAG6715411.1 hypothetical protein I3842_05G250700 [Carya illinoinensis]KAG7981392.1 hypothetical protein I3843_05G231500 [Carya illinoinensis]
MEMDLEESKHEEVPNCNSVCDRELVHCRCGELEERSKKAEGRCVELELDILKKKSENEVLEAKLRALEIDRLAIEDQLQVLKRENGELKKFVSGFEGESKFSSRRERIVDLTAENEDEDNLFQALIENKVLEYEKRRAESEVEVWKEKFRCLQATGTPLNDFPYKLDARTEEKKKGVCLEYGRRARKQLTFEEEKSPNKKLAPSTPGGARPASLCILDISDSENEQTTNIQLPASHNEGIQNVQILGDGTLASPVGSEKELVYGNSSKQTHYDENDEEDVDACNENLLFTPTSRRKRVSNIVTSDSESDEDDIPISKLKRMRLQEKVPGQVVSELNGCSVTATTTLGDNVKGSVTPPRRRVATLRKREGQGRVERNSSIQAGESVYHRGIPTSNNVEADSEEVGSDSEGESLGGFIVESSDVSHADDASSESTEVSDENTSESTEVSDENIDFGEILSKIQRRKDGKSKWEFEGDMLAELGKDSELCMKAVCALYRRQTSDEKFSKETFYNNHQGFSTFDAPRASFLAEFLTDGDPEGGLKKSVTELQEYDPKAVEFCRTMATRYSKQLFEIYKIKEDPHFLPS